MGQEGFCCGFSFSLCEVRLVNVGFHHGANAVKNYLAQKFSSEKVHGWMNGYGLAGGIAG